MMTTDWRLTFFIVSHYITAHDTVGKVWGILTGHFKSRTWAIYLRLMENPWTCTSITSDESAATTTPSPQPGSQGGPAAESWNDTPTNTTESRRIRFLQLGRLFRGTRTRRAPCRSSCYRTSVKSQGRCPCAGRGWFTNISGEYNYTAPPAEQPSAASGGSRGGVLVSAEWTLKSSHTGKSAG